MLDETLKQEIPTRWNSLLIMLLSFPKDNFDRVNGILRAHSTTKTNYNYLQLTDDDQKDIQDLISFLQPWKVESDRVQGDQYPTLQYVLVAASRLSVLSQPNESDSFKIRHLRARAAQLLDRKFKPDDLHRVAASLWPDFRRLLMERNVANRRKVFNLVGDLLKDFADEDEVVARKRCRLEDGYDQWRGRNTADEEENDVDEVETYLQADFPLVDGKDLLVFWKREAHRLSKLAKLAKRILCIPASSSSSERAFSVAGLIFTPRRTCLAPDHLDDMIVLRSYLTYKEAV